jgi:hypothetical protein
MSTTVTSVASHFPSAQNGFTTTLASTISSGAATVPLNSVAGYTNGQVAVFVVDPTDPVKKQTFTGIVDTSGVQLTSVVWTAGTNTSHSGGATIVDYATATHISMITKGLLVQHTQAGAHGVVTATSLSATGVINASTVSSLQDTSVALSTYRTEDQYPFTASGGVWSGDAYASTRNASMTAWVGHINGQRGTISAVTARSFTASKDTYVDVLNTAGVFTLVYTEVTNNAASPALAANSIRIAIVVTGASNIAAATSINQGQLDRILPIASSIAYSLTDSLGNLIYNTTPNPVLIGYRQVLTSQNTTSSTAVQITGLTCPINVPTSRNIEGVVEMTAAFNNSGGQNILASIWDGVVGVGTQKNVGGGTTAAAAAIVPVRVSFLDRVSGVKTYNGAFNSSAGSTAATNAGSTQPVFISIKLI